MGILCEIFVSSRRDALKFEKLLSEASPPAYLRGEAKGLMPVDFEVLWSVLLNEPFDPTRHQLEDVYFGSHYRTPLGRIRQRLLIWKAMAKELLGSGVGDSWLHRFPFGLVGLLASLDDSSLRRAAPAWLSKAEIAHRSAEDVELILADLRRLAAQAQQSRRHMFVWGSV